MTGSLARIVTVLILTSSVGGATSILSDTAVVQLTTHPERDAEPSVSPDGRWIAFASRRSGNWDIWVKHVNGGMPYRVTTSPAIDRQPRWTHDGHGILFVSTRDDPRGDIFRIEVKRKGTVAWTVGEPRRLTPRFCLDMEFDPHPSGKTVAFISDRSGRPDVWLLRLNNLHTRLLAPGPARNPRWSPDGEWLAWLAVSEGESRIVYARYDTRRDTLRTPPDTLVLNILGRIRSFDFGPAQRHLVCLVHMTEEAADSIASLWIVPLPDSLSLRGQAPPSPLDSLPRHPYVVRWIPRPVKQTAWRHGYRIYTDEGGDIRGAGPVGGGPIPDSARKLLAWVDSRFPAPSHLGNYAETALSEKTLWRRVEGFGHVIAFFPNDVDAVARALYFRACAFWQLGRSALAMADLDSVSRMGNIDPVLRCAAQFLAADIRLSRRGLPFPLIDLRTTCSPRDTAAYAMVRQEPTCPPQLRTLASLRIAQLHLACNDTLAAKKALRAATASPSDTTLLPFVDWCQLLTERPGTQSWWTVLERLLRRVGPPHPLLEEATRATLAACEAEPTVSLLDTLKCWIRTAEELRPRSAAAAATVRYWAGHYALLRGHPREAVELLSPFRDAKPNTALTAHALHDLSLALLEVGQPDSAISILEELVRTPHVPRNVHVEARETLARACVERATQLSRQGDPIASLGLLAKARQLTPDDPLVHREFVRASALADKLDETCVHYRQAHLLHPENPVFLYAYGLCLSYQATREAERAHDLRKLNLKRLRASTQFLELALRRDFRLLPAYLALAFNYEQMELYAFATRRSARHLLGTLWRALTAPARAAYEFVMGTGGRPTFGYRERAIQLLRAALHMADETTPPALRADLLLNLANNLYALGPYSYPKALVRYRQRLRAGVPFPTRQQEAEVYLRMGSCALHIGQFDSAASYLSRAWDLSRELRDPGRAIVSANLLAFALQNAGQPGQAIQVLRSLREQFGGILNPRARERLHRNMALAYRALGWTDSCLVNVARAQWLIESGQVPDIKREPVRISLEILGFPVPVPFLDLRRFGLRHLGESQDLTNAEELALLEQVAVEALLDAGRLAQAIRHALRKVQIQSSRGDQRSLAIALHQLGRLYLLSGLWDRAAETFRRSWDVALRNQDPEGLLASVESLLLTDRYADRFIADDSLRLALVSQTRPLLMRTAAVVGKSEEVSTYWRRRWELITVLASLQQLPFDTSASETSLVEQTWNLLAISQRTQSLLDTLRRDSLLAHSDLIATALHAAALSAHALGDTVGEYRYWAELRALGIRQRDLRLAARATAHMAQLLPAIPQPVRREMQIPWTGTQLADVAVHLLVAACLEDPPALPEDRQLLLMAYQVRSAGNADSLRKRELAAAFARDLLTVLFAGWHPSDSLAIHSWSTLRQVLIEEHLAASGLRHFFDLGQKATSGFSSGFSSDMAIPAIRSSSTLPRLLKPLRPAESASQLPSACIDRAYAALFVPEAGLGHSADGDGEVDAQWRVRPNPVVPLFSLVLTANEPPDALRFRTLAELISGRFARGTWVIAPEQGSLRAEACWETELLLAFVDALAEEP